MAQKLGIGEYLKELGVPYTIIDVGWWMQYYLPLTLRSTVAPPMKATSWTIYGSGEDKTLLTNVHHIGRWAAKIIADPRTLNKQVIVWEDEVTQNVAHEMGERVSGDGEALKAKRIQVSFMCTISDLFNRNCWSGIQASEEEVQQQITERAATIAKDPADIQAAMKLVYGQYMLSLHFLRENTLENAKRLGYLDARELYPDVSVQSLEEYAKEFYNLPEPVEYYQRE